MRLRFTKMHGIGNDFMVVDGVTQTLHFTREQIVMLADRHKGIGFDQLLVVEPPQHPQHDFFYRVYNSDGSPSGQCGNGARCFALFIWNNRLTVKSTLRLGTTNGSMAVKRDQDGLIKVNMGSPILSAEQIPIDTNHVETLNNSNSSASENNPHPSNPSISYSLSVESISIENIDIENNQLTDSDTVNFYALSMGNPHAVIVVDDVHSAPVESLGPLMQQHPAFPQSVNVGFMEIVGPHEINLRVYERGVGETLACGSGACAAVVAAILHGHIEAADNAVIQVNLPGGFLQVQWHREQNASVVLKGPATIVYLGNILI